MAREAILGDEREVVRMMREEIKYLREEIRSPPPRRTRSYYRRLCDTQFEQRVLAQSLSPATSEDGRSVKSGSTVNEDVFTSVVPRTTAEVERDSLHTALITPEEEGINQW